MPQPTLTVILPTYNRVALLKHAIAALLRQTAPADSYEIVVVDNNSSDGTSEAVMAIGDPRIRVIRESRQGLSHARNAGLEAARAPIVVFTDDDVEAAPAWVETIVAALDANPQMDGVGGRVLPAWVSQRPSWLTREHWAPLALQDHGDGRQVFDRARPTGLVGANLALRRTVFDRVGLFSPDVQRVKDGIGSTEDHDLLSRLYDAGGRLLYEPRMLVMARVQPDRYDRRYHRRWHEGHGRFHALMRNPDMERARMSAFGVPGHLLRTAVGDAARWLTSMASANWERAFLAELRLRFFKGFVWTRLAQ